MIFGESLRVSGRGRGRGGLGRTMEKIMSKKLFLSVIISCVLTACLLPAEDAKLEAKGDAKSVIAAVEKAMGGADLKSIQYSGIGSNANLGQGVNPTAAWPRFDVTSYTRTINYADSSSKEELTRIQGNNPVRGGGPPIMGEQKQNNDVAGNFAWNAAGPNPVAQFGSTLEERKLQIWMTPHGFLKLAKLGNGCAINWECEAKVSKKTEAGKPLTVISVGFGKYPLEAFVDDKNMITKVEAKFPNPVLGDMLITTTYADYKDYAGVKFPTRITQTQGPYPVFDLMVKDVKPNAPAPLPVPDGVKTAEAPRNDVSDQLLAEGVWYLTGGTHHSLVVEFKDYMAIIEAPLSEERSEAVLAEAKRLVINKPVKYLINTHQHFDHSGGLRTYVAEGATIITHPMNKAFYDQMFKMKPTIAPDRLAKNPKVPVILPVMDRYVLTDGTQKIEIYAMKDDNHNEGMLIAYIPAGKILVEADEYNPPAADAAPPLSPPASSLNLYDNIQRLKLDVSKIAPIHGRLVSMADFLKFLGRKPELAENKKVSSAAPSSLTGH
jgi:glyoxylase-like metal-dependent hydrolase (beta-lactamase superfamily II)